MIRRFFKDSALYAAAGFLTRGISFLLFPFLAHVLEPRAYGIIDIASLLSILALLTVALEISQGLGRSVGDLDDPSERQAFASTALIYSVLSYAGFAVLVVVLSGPLTALVFGQDVNDSILRLMAIGTLISGVLYLVQEQLRWQLRPRAYVAVSVTAALFTTVSIAIYVLILKAAALGVIAGQATGAGCALVMALALSRGTYQLRFDREKCRQMLTFSIPLVPSSIGVFLNGYADRFVIQHKLSLADVGIYGVGVRLSVIVSLLLLGFQGAMLPLVLARHRDPSVRHEIAHIFRLFCAMAAVVFVWISLLAQPMLRVLTAPAYATAYTIVPFVVLATLLGGMYFFAPGPFIARRNIGLATINIIAGFLNLGLAFGLVPIMGIRGAGVATLVSSAFAFIGWMMLSQRFYRVPHNWSPLLRMAVLAIGLVAFVEVAIPRYVGSSVDINMIFIRTALCVIGSITVLLLILTREELRLGGRVLLISLSRRAKAAGVDA